MSIKRLTQYWRDEDRIILYDENNEGSVECIIGKPHMDMQISRLYVSALNRRKGVGYNLINEAYRLAVREGCGRIFIMLCDGESEDWMSVWLEKCGFKFYQWDDESIVGYLHISNRSKT